MPLTQAIFRTLSSSKFHSIDILPPGLLVTAKGFPDLSTREFLHLLSSVDYGHNLLSPLPMFCLVDNDPYGLGIYGVYKYGGEKLSAIERERLALTELRFLGIRAGDFKNKEGIIRLTERDRRKIDVMTKKEWVQGEMEVMYSLRK